MKVNTYLKVTISIGLLIVIGVAFIVFIDPQDEDELTLKIAENQAEALKEDELQAENETIVPQQEKICVVQVGGAVKTPGIYKVPEGTRIYEVFELAGGLTDEADPYFWNQAEIVYDRLQLIVPTVTQVEEGFTMNQQEEDATIINLNTATIEQLMMIPNIGEAKARSIIEYRTSIGKFKAKEEIMNIEGIKEGIYNKIKNFITVK